MAEVVLLWLPLGAGGHVVRWNGRVYEALCALRDGRPRLDLYHAALLVDDGERTWAIELAPAAGPGSGAPGVVATGPVGLRVAGRSRWFRYEVRRRPDGLVPDAAYAVERRVLSHDPRVAVRLLDAAPRVPLLVWGRDAVGAHDMWNSNSAVAWMLAAAGTDPARVGPPPGGRAPGWTAGVVAAAAGTDAVRVPSGQRTQADPDA